MKKDKTNRTQLDWLLRPRKTLKGAPHSHARPNRHIVIETLGGILCGFSAMAL